MLEVQSFRRKSDLNHAQDSHQPQCFHTSSAKVKFQGEKLQNKRTYKM